MFLVKDNVLMFPKSIPKKRKSMANYAKKAIKNKCVASVVKRKVKKKTKLPKKVKIKSLEAKLKSLLYPLIKKEEPNKCVSCPKKNMIGRDHQVGHFIKAELCNLIWRYNRRILHPQCSACNLWKRGNYVEYRKWMIKKFGEIDVKIMEELYNTPLPMNFNSREYLLAEIKKYASKNTI